MDYDTQLLETIFAPILKAINDLIRLLKESITKTLKFYL